MKPSEEKQLKLKIMHAYIDISADAFWGTEKQRAFFDVRIFNPNAPSYQNANLDAIYPRQEKEKRRSYEERVTEEFPISPRDKGGTIRPFSVCSVKARWF